jgi:uncharacterized protein YlzI (FlbEa/FlbD family)
MMTFIRLTSIKGNEFYCKTTIIGRIEQFDNITYVKTSDNDSFYCKESAQYIINRIAVEILLHEDGIRVSATVPDIMD